MDERVTGVWMSVALLGCGEPATAADADANEDTAGTEAGDENPQAPEKSGAGSAEFPRARQVARLGADQFHASLIVATGQAWTEYPTYSASLGKPDLAEVTDENRSYSISFDKFVHDAARATCRLAIDAELDGGAPVLLVHASVSERDQALYAANLEYLFLRFLAVELGDDDPRAQPFMDLLLAPPPAGEELDDARMADRWWAVCVGLATHPDFLSY